jgi:citrate lyase subunit beta/citryl-CoA lyase
VLPRSWLYVPGDQPDKLSKAGARGADALIADLEDAVAMAYKERGRRMVGEWLTSQKPQGVQVWVRVNIGEHMAADLDAVVRPGLDGVCLPKAASSEDLERLDMALSVRERSAGMAEGSVPVVPLIESGLGVLAVADVARAPRVAALAMGEADLAADLGMDPSADERELWPIRAQVVVASAAARLDRPVAPVSIDFRDLEAYRSSTELLRRMGFGGRPAIHPAQIAVINEVFTPSEQQIEWARRVVELLDRAVRAGTGVTVDDRGRLLDEAIVRQARRVLDMVDSTAARGG